MNVAACRRAREELDRAARFLGCQPAELVLTRFTRTIGEIDRREIVMVYYGMRGDPPMTYRDLGERFSVSAMSASHQVENFWFRVLREVFKRATDALPPKEQP